MLEPLVVTAFPFVFLVLLFGSGAVFRRRQMDIDGVPPIRKGVYLTSKYLIIVVWVATALHSWGIRISFFPVPRGVQLVALGLWVIGFLLLFTGRFTMGNSFRIGTAKEHTTLTVHGLFRCSRNPMYLGVFTTLLAATLYTLNPIVLLIAIFIIVVHHRIVLAEEAHLRSVFGEAYMQYCQQVRRYI